MPRLPEPQRRLVCAQARDLAAGRVGDGPAALRAAQRAARLLDDDGWGEARRLVTLAFRVARRYGERG